MTNEEGGHVSLVQSPTDFLALPRFKLQALSKKNGIRANQSNVAMVDALRSLAIVMGMEEMTLEARTSNRTATKGGIKIMEKVMHLTAKKNSMVQVTICLSLPFQILLSLLELPT